jgi:phage-related protein (TIGR01555 family)
MSVGKYKVSGLADMLDTPGGKESLQRRIELMDMTRSVYRSQYFDTTEDFVRENANFTGVPEILYIVFMLLSADTGYPITRLFGVSPGGMNATGDSDMRNYYDAVRSEQANVLRPVILRLVRIISRWQGIEESYIEFPPLETMNEKEQAELDNLKAAKESSEAATYKAYIDAGILEPHEARWLKVGNTLDDIPEPEETELPPVEMPVEPPEDKPEDKPEEGGEEPEGAGE